MFVFGHLGLALLGARLLAPLLRRDGGFPVAVLLVGALLPDLIDKPLGHFVLPWDNGRLWAHTLVFALTLAALAWAAGSRRLQALSFGVGFHQLLDQMPWADPAGWLWPFGGAFARDVSPGMPDWWAALTSDPYIWTTETLGLVALVALLVVPYLGWTRAWWRAPTPGEAPSRVAPLRPGASERDAEP